jgi:hypothetical protein
LIPHLDVKGRRTEDQQPDPLSVVFRHIPQHLPDHGAVFQIMFGGQFFIKVLALGILDEANRQGLQEQRFWRRPGNRTIEKMNRHAPS